MSPLLVTILARTLAGAVAASAVPTAINMEPSAPVPSSMEEAIAQVVTALIVVGTMYVQKLKAKKSEQK